MLSIAGAMVILQSGNLSAAEKKKPKPQSGAAAPEAPAAASPAPAAPATSAAGTPADSPAAPSTGSAQGPVATADRAPAEDPDHAIKLRGLEERVNDLKERIFRSKARLILLRETVLNSVISGAKALIVHHNEMGSSFVLESASYSLDGAPIFNKTESAELDQKEEIELFNGSIVPGNHNLSVLLVYRGNGYGVFSYLKGYKFKIKSSYAFTAEEGRLSTIKVVAYEKGGITTDLKDRPAIRYDVEVKQDANVSPVAASSPPTGAEKPAAKSKR